MKRRVFALLMALVMVLSMMPMGTMATESETQPEQILVQESDPVLQTEDENSGDNSGNDAGGDTSGDSDAVEADTAEVLLELLCNDATETVLLTGNVTLSGGAESVVIDTADTLQIADGAFLAVESGATLKCPAGIFAAGEEELYNKLSAAALVMLEYEGNSAVLYGSMDDLRSDVENLPDEVASVELALKDSNAAYITLDFDLPYADFIYSDDNLEIASPVELHSNWLQVSGDCIWYREESIRDIAGSMITGLYPRLLTRPVFHDETGFHERLDGQTDGGHEFDRIWRDEFSAFYVQYFDPESYQWVFAPVDVNDLTVDGSFVLVSLADLGQDVPSHYGVYCADAWNVEGSIQANGVDGRELNLGYRLACYIGPVNFFHEPTYGEWCAIDVGGGGVSTMTGRTLYAASYLPEENLQDLYWYAVDPVTGNEMPIWTVAHFERMEDCGETVWEIRIPSEVICDYPSGLSIGVRGRACDSGDEWDFGTELDIYPQEALGWTAENVGDELPMDMFGILEDHVSVPAGESVTGWVYKTYYNEDEGRWKAGLYAADENCFGSEGDVTLQRVSEDDARTIVGGTVVGGSDNRIVWLQETSDGFETDWSVIPLDVQISGRGESAAFYEKDSFKYWQIDEMVFSPLQDGVFFFGLDASDGVEITGVAMPENYGVTVTKPEGYTSGDYEGMYTVSIDAESLRSYYTEWQDVVFTLELTDGVTSWQETYALPVCVHNTMAWYICDTEPESIELNQVVDVMSMSPGITVTGVPVFVHYAELGEDHFDWVCTPVGGTQIWLDTPSFSVEENEENGLSTITCNSGSMGITDLFMKRMEDNQYLDEPDMDSFLPMHLLSDQPYLTVNWLDGDGEGRFMEGEGTDTGFRITPLDEYAVMFWLNWLDASDNTWKRTPVKPDSLMSEDGKKVLFSVRSLEEDQICSDQPNGDYFVWVKPHTDLWGETVELTATVGEGEDALTGSIPVEVDLHTGGFYTTPEISHFSYVNEWRDAGSKDLYFGVKQEEDWQLEGIYAESDLCWLEEMEGQPNMRNVVFDMNRLYEGDEWIKIRYELTNGDETRNEWCSIHVSAYGGTGFYIHTGDYELFNGSEGDTLALRVLDDTNIYFKPTEGSLVAGFHATMNGNALNWERQDDGYYKIVIPGDTTRALGNETAKIAVTVSYAGDREETSTVTAAPRHAVVWGWDNRGAFEITDSTSHGLSHELGVPVGSAVTGQIYYVWYNDIERTWIADAYGGDYLRLEGGGFEYYAMGGNHGPVILESYGTDETAFMRWTNHAFDENGEVTGPAEETDYGALPLALWGEESLPGGFYFSPEANDYDRVSELVVSPISGRSVYLVVDESVVAGTAPTVSSNVPKCNALGGGVFEIVISPAAAREFVPADMMSFTFATVDGGEVTFHLPVCASHAIAWGPVPEENQVIVIENDDHGLTSWVEMPPESEITGMVYYVYYRDEDGWWQADPYGGDYLRMEDKGAFHLENVPSDENDTHNYDDATIIYSHSTGMGTIWWTNHSYNEELDAWFPNGETDYSTFPLEICSTGAYLFQNWVYENEDGSWGEEWNEDTSCGNTPADGSHRHTFYIDYWVEGEGWRREPVVPQISRVVVRDEEGNDIEVENPEDYAVLSKVSDADDDFRVDVTVKEWNCVVTLTASYEVPYITESGVETSAVYTASMDISSELPREGFFAIPEGEQTYENIVTTENYITSFQPVWGSDNSFYLAMNSEAEGDAITDITTDNSHVSFERISGYLYRITVAEPMPHDEDLWLDVTLESGEMFGRGILLKGVSGYLGHRYLSNDGDGWFIGDGDYHSDLDNISPGADRWFIFSYVPAEGDAQNVEVTITEGADFVEFDKVEELEDERITGDHGEYYYRLLTHSGADVWDQTITLTATVGEGEDAITVSDTFTIREDMFSWYSEPATEPDTDTPDRSCYITEFTLTQDNSSVYLFPRLPDGWWIEEIFTGWEDEEGWHPYSGGETVQRIEWMHPGFFEIRLDPETVQRSYGRHGFGLDLQFRCRSEWGDEEIWGAGIYVNNLLPYLTASRIDWDENGLLVPTDDHEDGMRINPQQNRFHVYYLNVFNGEDWDSYPVQPELRFFDGDEGGYAWLEKNEEPNCGDTVAEFGHFLRMNEDAWGHSFAIYGSYWDEESDETYGGYLPVEVARDHVNFYSSPIPSTETYLDYFRLSDLSGGNVFYVGAEDDWVIDSVSTKWTNEDGETGYYRNAELVTVERVTGRAWKVTVDTERVREHFGRDGFDLELRVETSRHGENYAEGDGREIGIYIENNLPYLQYIWLENHGNGWFMPVDENGNVYFEDGFGMFPEEEFYQLYALTYYDRMGNQVTAPVIPSVSEGVVSVETLSEREEWVDENQENGDKFVVLTSPADSWDTRVVLEASSAGHTGYLEAFVGRGEAGLYTSATDLSNATVIKDLYRDPVNTENNVFWFAIEENDWADLDVDSVTFPETDLATFKKVGKVDNFHVWQVALTETGTAYHDDSFYLHVDYTWVSVNDENERHDRGYDIWVHTGDIEGHVAMLRINHNEYFFVDDGSDTGATRSYTWTEDGIALQSVEGLSYNSQTNTLTLTNAHLQQLEISAEDLPNSNLTIELVGENTISGGSHDSALFLRGGVDLTITAEETATFDITSTNTVYDGTDDTDPWCHPAIALWENGDGSLTVSGAANVTVTVNGEEYETDEEGNYIIEDGERIPCHMSTISGGESRNGTLLVTDNATLTVTPPEDLLSRWNGIDGFQRIELHENATLNTSRLDFHSDSSALMVMESSTLNVGMIGDDNSHDDEPNYYFGGIYIRDGYLTIADSGTVNVTAPDFATDRRLYTNAVHLQSGSFGFLSGELNIDLGGFTVAEGCDPELLDGCGLRLGDSEDYEGSVKWGVDGGNTLINLGEGHFTGVDVGANATAELQRGSLRVNGYQGVVNQGLVRMYDGMTVTLLPWEDESGNKLPTDYAMFINDIHYAARRVAALQMFGGVLEVEARDNTALISQGELTQSGGEIIVSSPHITEDGLAYSAADFLGKTIITGGSMTVTAPAGMYVASESVLPQNYFRLAGGKLTVNCTYNGVVALAPVVLQGGSLTVNQSDETDMGTSSTVYVTEGGSLTVTGGEHFINGSSARVLNMGLRTLGGAPVRFQGGKTTITAPAGALLGDTIPDENNPEPANPIVLAPGMYMHESERDVALEFLAVQTTAPAGEVTVLRYTPGTETEDGVTPLASVVIEPGQGTVKPVVEATAHVEVATAKPTAGAYITIQSTVTAEDGTVSFDLESGATPLELVENSITINGVSYSRNSLEDIPVEGSASIVFRVISRAATTASAEVRCTLKDGEKTVDATTGSFTIHAFQLNAPNYTTYETITVRGTAAPGSELKLYVTGLNDDVDPNNCLTIEVTELGTFAEEIELPIREGAYNAQTFTLRPWLDGEEQTSYSVVYNPTSVRLDFLRITNQVVDSMGIVSDATNEVSFLSGTGMPNRSFYTYIPDMNLFDFETEFYVPLGWIITDAWVEVTYIDKDIEPERLTLREDEGAQIFHWDGSRTEFWTVSKELQGAPTDFKVIYKVARIKSTVIPDPDPCPNDPGYDPDDYVEEEEERITDVIPLLPIIDPSGTVYSGSVDNPVAGASVTLYFGGTGETPVPESKPFNMTQYGQVNPQITDGSGHYSWDVPTGWWKVVAEKDGFRAESQWIHVLPAHTDLHLNLNLPGAESGTYDLTRIRPLTINGKIPTGAAAEFSVEVSITNFTAAESAVLLVASYTEDGRFLGMQTMVVDGLEKGVSTTVPITLHNSDGEAGMIKAFLVNNTTEMIPITAKVEFSNSDS